MDKHVKALSHRPHFGLFCKQVFAPAADFSIRMETDFKLHLTPDQLELYFLGHAPVAAVDSVEEHLLMCERCRTKLEETETEIRALRIALRSWDAAPTVH